MQKAKHRDRVEAPWDKRAVNALTFQSRWLVVNIRGVHAIARLMSGLVSSPPLLTGGKHRREASMPSLVEVCHVLPGEMIRLRWNFAEENG